MSDESEDRKKGKGFAGLSSLVSDVSEDIVSATPSSASGSSGTLPPEPKPPQSNSESTSAPPQGPNSPAGSPTGSGGGTKVVWGIIGGVVFLFLISLSGKKEEVARPPTAYTAPAAAPEVVAPVVAAPEATSRSEPQQVPPAISVSINTDKPPVGRSLVLNDSQLRYCLSEKIRMQAIEGIFSKNSQDEINRFNARVDDYNSRCGEYRYRRSALGRATQDVESNREAIAAEAKTVWVRESLKLESPPAPAETKQTSTQKASPENAKVAKEPSSDTLTYEEQSSIEAACNVDKQFNGPAAYKRCVSNKIAALKKGARSIDLSALNYDEKSSIESSCNVDKQFNGPAAYNRCLANKLAALKSAPRSIDLSGLNYDEKSSIESSCNVDKQFNGPAAYNRCLSNKLAALRTAPRNIDLSGLSYDEKSSIESSCNVDKQFNGPAAYNKCQVRLLKQLKR